MQTHDIPCPPSRRRASHSWVSRNRLSPPGKSNQIAPNPGKNISSASCPARTSFTSFAFFAFLARPSPRSKTQFVWHLRHDSVDTSSKKVLTGGYGLPESG